MATAGFAHKMKVIASSLTDIETLEGFNKTPAVEAKIRKLVDEAARAADKAYFSLDGSPVSEHVIKGIMEHLAHMSRLYGEQ